MSITDGLDQIINNFDLQAGLYGKMAELACVQLDNLKDSTYTAGLDEVNRILAERKAILTEIAPLNNENKKLQQEIMDELQIEQFNIKSLKVKIPAEQFARLKTAINEVEKLLRAIDKSDRESELIMRRRVPGKADPAVTSQKAAQAYKQAKKPEKTEN